jgi:hypothetical protein
MARGGIEPPTRGFSDMSPSLRRISEYPDKYPLFKHLLIEFMALGNSGSVWKTGEKGQTAAKKTCTWRFYGG